MTATENSQFLSPVQRRLISIALVFLALILIGAFFFGIFVLLRWLVVYFADILWPLAVAGILALLLKPLVQRLEKTLKTGRIGAIVLIYALAIIVLLLLAALILPVIFSQAGAFIEYLPVMMDRLGSLVGRFFPDATGWMQETLNAEALREHLKVVSRYVQDIMKASLPALNTLGDYLSRTLTMAVGLLIIPVYLFFFLYSSRNPLRAVDEQLSFIPERVREDITFLAEEFTRIMVAFFRGQILISMIMGVLLAVGFSVISLKYGAFLGIIIGFLNIIPYLGSILGLILVLPLAYVQQDGGLVLLMSAVAVFAVVQLVESYLLTPRIMGSSTGLHPLAIIIAILFWGKALGGILGMVLAIPLTAFFVVVWRLIRKKYLLPESAPAGQQTE